MCRDEHAASFGRDNDELDEGRPPTDEDTKEKGDELPPTPRPGGAVGDTI